MVCPRSCAWLERGWHAQAISHFQASMCWLNFGGDLTRLLGGLRTYLGDVVTVQVHASPTGNRTHATTSPILTLLLVEPLKANQISPIH